MTFLAEFLHWWVPWEPSVTVWIAFPLAVWLYVRGARRSPVTAPVHRQVFFWLGMALLWVCLQTNLDYFAEHEFFIHRLQHLGLHHLAPFLIVLAYPGVTMRRGLPVWFRRHWLRPVLAWPPLRAALDVLLNPVVAGLLFVGLIYFWLWPSVFFVTMLNWRQYHLMNFSMVADGLLFWWLILDHRPRPPARLSPMMRMLTAFLAIIPQILIGAYITFTKTDLYPIFSVCGRAFGGISPMMDQRLGGLLIWIPGGMMTALGGGIAFGHWIRLDSKGRLARNRHRPRRSRRAGAAPVPEPKVEGVSHA
ncbi:MAG TPA: cytochrome c oxidase assembly protein [Nevskiaceae bacterium]